MFEDGDRLDGVLDHNVFTEKQYKAKFGTDPPEPRTLYNWNDEEELYQGMGLNRDHDLFGKGFCRKWRDVDGLIRTSFGVIGDCYESLDHSKETFFKIKYRNTQADDESEVETPLATIEDVSEKVAWGGYLTYVEETGAIQDFSKVPFHVKWLLPDLRRIDSKGRLVMEIRGFRLVFAVQESSIEGAGLGLLVTVTERTGEGRKHLVLKLGELLGLGPYAPLYKQDRKLTHVFEVKNFIHGYEPGVYVFDANGRDHAVFDVTDDKTGKLHDRAVQNPLMRVNETNGKDFPTVVADFDPSGAVEYCLGRGVVGQGDLQIPVDVPFELMVSLPSWNRLFRSF